MGAGVYRASVGMWSADLQSTLGGKRAMNSSKGTLHDSRGSHESCQINTQTAMDSNRVWIQRHIQTYSYDLITSIHYTLLHIYMTNCNMR